MPEDRLHTGVAPSLSIASNVVLKSYRGREVVKGPLLRLRTIREYAAQLIKRYDVRGGGPDLPARRLSGGNLQKFIVGREIDANPKLLVISQPTWGVDVGAAAQIRAEILALRDAGCAVLVVSEELEELFEVSDRLHVIAKGRLSPSLPRAQATVEKIGEWMSGLWEGAHAEA